MRRFLPVFILLAIFGQVAPSIAAPLWIERKFIPEPALIDPSFKTASQIETVKVDHDPWSDFLSAYVVEGDDGVNRVRYGAVDLADHARLEGYIGSLEAIDTSTLTRDQQLAYWINLYNAATVRLILDQYPIASIRKVKVEGSGPWEHKAVSVMRQNLSLGDIEHHIVRALFPDPRIHYALNCASIGCPNLATTAYTSSRLEEMLETASVAYVNHPRGVELRKAKADISKIYGWYREDFGDTRDAVLAHLRQYARGDLALRLADVTKIGRYDYDWSLNDVSAQPQN